MKESGQYREFVTINRIRGQYPLAQSVTQKSTEQVVVWCSNDYLGMSQHHIYLQPINSPTVPIGTERFRVNVTPNHTKEQIEKLAFALTEIFHYFGISFSHEQDFLNA